MTVQPRIRMAVLTPQGFRRRTFKALAIGHKKLPGMQDPASPAILFWEDLG
jgi:hypothetical protein